MVQKYINASKITIERARFECPRLDQIEPFTNVFRVSMRLVRPSETKLISELKIYLLPLNGITQRGRSQSLSTKGEGSLPGIVRRIPKLSWSCLLHYRVSMVKFPFQSIASI